MKNGNRPSPESLLAKLNEGEQAKLRVYIGAAPGVGKTYQMLEDAHLLKKQGVDIVVAVVGDDMKGHPGVSGKIFGALGRHNVNISAIAQGASERNISCVIDVAQQARALNIIHQAFFEVRKRLALVVIGVGNIGGTLLRQMHEQRAYLLGRGFDVTVVGVANSRWFVLEGNGINLARWRERLSASRRRMDPQVLAREIAKTRADRRSGS